MDSGVGTATAAAIPGAMSLLDKYAAINSSIDDARRRVSDARSKLEQCNLKIQTLVDDRNGMDSEIEQASNEKMRLSTELKEAEKLHQAKLMEKDRVQSDQRLAKSEFDKMRQFIEDERMEFLEHCREFRSSCKRLRIESSILVLETGPRAGLNENDTPDEGGLWRRLQEEDFSDRRTSNQETRDLEIEIAEMNDNRNREELMENEALLHAERKKHDEAIKRSSARNQRLTQQRAQLQRHRKEIEDLEREIESMKNAIIEENQLAQTYEKEYTRKKHVHDALLNASSKDASFHTSHTPPNLPSSGHQPHARAGVVTNPYNKQLSHRTPASNARWNHPTNNSDRSMQSGKGGNIILSHESTMTHGITPDFHLGQRSREMTATQQYPNRGGYARNQRQFGTSVGVSIASEGMYESRTTSTSATIFPPSSGPSSMHNMTNTEDSASDISSASSDEDILSFNIFGKK